MNTLQKTIVDALTSNVTRIRSARRSPRCAFVKINGLRCGSPALHRHRLCYFHNRMRLPRPNGAPFPPLEDGASIQYALMTVLQDLRDQKIDHRTAGLLLYGLQTASFNLRQSQFSRGDVVRSDPGELLQSEGVPLLAQPPEIPAPRRSPRAKSGSPQENDAPELITIPTIHACADNNYTQPNTGSQRPTRHPTELLRHQFPSVSSVSSVVSSSRGSARKPPRYAKL